MLWIVLCMCQVCLLANVSCIVLCMCLLCLLANTTKGQSVHTTEVFVNLSLLLAALLYHLNEQHVESCSSDFSKFSKIWRTWENTCFRQNSYFDENTYFVKVHYLDDFLTQYFIYLCACLSVLACPQMRSSEPVFPQRSLAHLREMTGRSDRPVVSPGGGGGGRWIPPPSGTWLSW